MSVSNMQVHGVSSIKLKAVSSEKDATWRDIQVYTAEGHTFTLTLFANDVYKLRINPQEIVVGPKRQTDAKRPERGVKSNG